VQRAAGRRDLGEQRAALLGEEEIGVEHPLHHPAEAGELRRAGSARVRPGWGGARIVHSLLLTALSVPPYPLVPPVRNDALARFEQSLCETHGAALPHHRNPIRSRRPALRLPRSRRMGGGGTGEGEGRGCEESGRETHPTLLALSRS